MNFSGTMHNVGPRGGQAALDICVMREVSLKSDQQPNEVLNK